MGQLENSMESGQQPHVYKCYLSHSLKILEDLYLIQESRAQFAKQWVDFLVPQLLYSFLIHHYSRYQEEINPSLY